MTTDEILFRHWETLKGIGRHIQAIQRLRLRSDMQVDFDGLLEALRCDVAKLRDAAKAEYDDYIDLECDDF